MASYLMCHAPIVIPEVAQENSPLISASTGAMRKIANEIVDLNPDVLLVLSPHTPRRRGEFSVIGGSQIYGNFSKFSHPEIEANFPNASMLLNHTWSEIAKHDLDHGALVPLYFIYQSGWRGPVAVVSLPYDDSALLQRDFSKQLSDLIVSSQKKWVLIASGDMSHRLIKGAPAGYHPLAKEFDQTVVELVRGGEYKRLSGLPQQLREVAAEDVIDTFNTIAATTNYRANNRVFYSYEGPFGVGYLMARIYREDNHVDTN